jgi:hypothetical protein
LMLLFVQEIILLLSVQTEQLRCTHTRFISFVKLREDSTVLHVGKIEMWIPTNICTRSNSGEKKYNHLLSFLNQRVCGVNLLEPVP